MLSSCNSPSTANDEKCAKIHTHTQQGQVRKRRVRERESCCCCCCLCSLATCINNGNIWNQSSDCRKRKNEWAQNDDATRRDGPGKPYSQFPVSNLPCLASPSLCFPFVLPCLSSCLPWHWCPSASVSVALCLCLRLCVPPSRNNFISHTFHCELAPIHHKHTHTQCTHVSSVCVCRVQCCFIFSAKFMNFQPIFSHPALLLNTVSSINWF